MGRAPACLAETMENLPVERTACAALGRAPIAPSRDRRWAAPFYRAGFTLEGEWR